MIGVLFLTVKRVKGCLERSNIPDQGYTASKRERYTINEIIWTSKPGHTFIWLDLKEDKYSKIL